MQLVVADALEHGVHEQPGDLLAAAVPLVAELLEHERGRREQQAEADGDQEERDEVGRGDHAEDPQDDGEDEPNEREHRAEELEHREVRHRDQADPAVARVEEHPLMSAEPFPEASLPSAALAAERRELLGHLGPADRIRDERDAVRLAALAQVAVEAERQLEVLADGLGPVPADGLEQRPVEQPEGAGDDARARSAAPADAGDEERPEVLEDLHRGEAARGSRASDDAPVVDAAAVGDPDRSAGRRQQVGVVEDRLGRP